MELVHCKFPVHCVRQLALTTMKNDVGGGVAFFGTSRGPRRVGGDQSRNGTDPLSSSKHVPAVVCNTLVRCDEWFRRNYLNYNN